MPTSGTQVGSFSRTITGRYSHRRTRRSPLVAFIARYELQSNMSNTILPFPLPAEAEFAQNATTALSPSLPSGESVPSATVNLTTTLSTLSTTTVSRAARSAFTTAVTTASWTRLPNTTDEVEWLLGGPDDWNLTLNSTFGNSTTGGSKNIFEEQPWLMWMLIGVGVLLIVCVVIMLVIWYFCNKKKNSQQERTPLAAATPTSENRMKTLLPCCATCFDKPTRNVADSKPLNDANLNPYKRPPLPPIGTSQSIMAGEIDGYQGGHLPAQRLAPIKRNSTFDQFNSQQMLGANIQGLKGVPMIYVRTEDMRPLPQLD